MKSKNVLIIAMIAMIGIVSNVALALPQYLDAYNETFNTQATCALCHVNPAGGGLLQYYGTLFQSQANHVTDPRAALRSIGDGVIVIAPETSAPESHTDVFVDIYTDNYQGFYRIEPFYVDLGTHAKVPVNTVKGTSKDIVINEDDKVILEWINTGGASLTIQLKDKSSGNVLYTEKMQPGYEVTYTIDTSGIYEARIVELVGVDGHNEEQHIMVKIRGSEPR